MVPREERGDSDAAFLIDVCIDFDHRMSDFIAKAAIDSLESLHSIDGPERGKE